MKKLLVFCAAAVAIVSSSGCAAKDTNIENTPAKVETHKSDAMQNEAIVVFNKGIALSEAKKILEGYGIVVVKTYKTLSEQNNQLYLLVKSASTTEEMVKTLKNDSSVHSVSPNRKNRLF